MILTVGTFLNGLIHVGQSKFGGGRASERPSLGLSNNLEKLGLKVGRLKTGTPPRIDMFSVDFFKDGRTGWGRLPTIIFFIGEKNSLPQVSCHVTHTNEETHKIIQESIELSPMYNGTIKRKGLAIAHQLKIK